MEIQSHDHSSGSGSVASKITLSPLAMLAVGLLMPIVGSMVRDRISTGGDAAVSASQIQAISDALKTHLADSVHRGEFVELQSQAKGAVSQDQFTTYNRSVDARLDSIREDLKDIKDGLRTGRR